MKRKCSLAHLFVELLRARRLVAKLPSPARCLFLEIHRWPRGLLSLVRASTRRYYSTVLKRKSYHIGARYERYASLGRHSGYTPRTCEYFAASNNGLQAQWSFTNVIYPSWIRQGLSVIIVKGQSSIITYQGFPTSEPRSNTQVYRYFGESHSPLLFSILSLKELNGVRHVKKRERI